MNLKKLMDGANKHDAVKAARELLAKHILNVGYGNAYDEYVNLVGDQETADSILLEQMKRALKPIGGEARFA